MLSLLLGVSEAEHEYDAKYGGASADDAAMILPPAFRHAALPPQRHQPGGEEQGDQEEEAYLDGIRTESFTNEVVHSRLPQKDEGRGFTGEKPTGDLAAYDQVCTIPVPGGYMP